MAQWIKKLSTKSDSLSSVPETHMAGEPTPHKLSSDLTHVHTHANTIIFKKKTFYRNNTTCEDPFTYLLKIFQQ